jgi:hypothetical protein
MNKEDKTKIHNLIKSDDSSNKLLGFILGRSGGLSDIELFELCYDGGFDYSKDVGPEVWQNLDINSFSFYLWNACKHVGIYHNRVAMTDNLHQSNENNLKMFTEFLNLIL